MTLCTMAERIILDHQALSTKRYYEKCSKTYEEFRKDMPHSEAVVLAYLTEESKTKVASTLWTVYSHVKKYLSLECSFDLGDSARISDFLKTLSRFHKKKKARAFSRDDLFRFLREAPNIGRDLVHKLVAITGFYGGLRACELTALTWEDVVFSQEGILIKIVKSKTDRAGIGSIKLLPKHDEKELCCLNYYTLYKSQVSISAGRLFCQFQNGKFIKAPLGKNTIASVPQAIATFLHLDNPELYTGHALRVTSATVLADQGANTLALKRHGRWKSEAVAEEYVRESKSVRTETAALLAGATTTLSTGTSPDESQAITNTVSFMNCVFSGPVIFQAPNINKE